jgi:2-dehydropantoate 2-reductase
VRKAEYAILGGGAVGSIVGAHLARAGHGVAVLARGRRAQQIATDGIRITGLDSFTVPVAVVSDPAELVSAEVLVVAVKALGTARSLAALQHADIGVVLSLQNGIAKDDLLAEAFGAARVLGAVANVSGELLASGEVSFTRNVSIVLGELDGRPSERTAGIAGAISGSGLPAAAVTDIRGQEWSKFAGWVGLMAVSVLTRLGTRACYLDAGTAAVLTRLVREIGILAKAHDIDLADDPALPVGAIFRGSEREGIELLARVGTGMSSNAPRHRISTLQDLEAGRPLELEETIGHAVRSARALGLHLPLLESVLDLASAIDRARR